MERRGRMVDGDAIDWRRCGVALEGSWVMTPPGEPGARDRAGWLTPGSRLLTLVFTDIVGSTALKQKLGDRPAAALIEQHHRLVRDLLARHPAAQEMATAGDSFLLAFQGPSDAVQFALRLQAHLRRFNVDRPVSLADRVGIHLGEVVMGEEGGGSRPGDLQGIAVDTCARVMSLAQGGQILMTRAVFDSARQMLKGEDILGVEALSWVSHGLYLLKGLEEPVEICEVAESGLGTMHPPETTEKGRRQTAGGEESVLGWRPAVGGTVGSTDWVLEEKLGEGGFGEVWVGRHRRLKERRVFKFCFRADRVRSLRRELTLFRLIKERIGDHPHIVALREVSFDEAPYFLEEDYVEGRDLARWCEMQGGVGAVPLEWKLEIAAQVAEALQAAHQCGVIHRDVKPGNILVSGEKSEVRGPGGIGSSKLAASPSWALRSPPHVKLTDFGIGQVVSEECLAGVTRAGFTETLLSSGSSRTGTPLYLAPELLAGGPATTRSDLYSLGVVLYQLLAGDFRRPVTTDWAKDIGDRLLRDDLWRCFAGDPKERFAAAGELARHLRDYRKRQASLAEAERLRRRAARWQRLAWAGLGIIVTLLVVAAGMGLRLGQLRKEREQARRGAYVADLRVIQEALREHDLKGACDALERQIPVSGQSDLRGWEWRYLWQRCQGDPATVFRHDGPVSWADVSGDGQWIASGCASQVWIWSVQERQVVCRIEPAIGGLSEQRLAFSPAGGRLATAQAKEVVVRETGTWRRLFALPATNAYVAFSGDGSILATYGDEGLQTWSAAEGAGLIRPGELAMATRGFQQTVALNEDGSLLAAGVMEDESLGRDNEVVLFDLARHTRRALPLGRSPPMALAFSADRRWLAASTLESGGIHVWSLPEARPVVDYEAHHGFVGGLAFSPDSQVLASAGADQLLCLWQVGTSNHWRSFQGHRGGVVSLRWLKDGQSLVSASMDGTVRIWPVSPAAAIRGDPLVLPAGRLLAGLSGDFRLLRTIDRAAWAFEEWDATRGTLIRSVRMQNTNLLQSLAAAPVIGGSVLFDHAAPARGVREGLWTAHAWRLMSASWEMLACSVDGKVLAWSARDGALVYSNQVAEGPVAAFPVDRSQRVYGIEYLEEGRRTQLFGWQAGRGRVFTLTDTFVPSPLYYSVSADGRWIAYLSSRGYVALYDTSAPRQQPQSIVSCRRNELARLAFAPRDARLAIFNGEGDILMYDAAQGRFTGHGRCQALGAIRLGYSADGRILMTFGSDLVARLWDFTWSDEPRLAMPLNSPLLGGVMLPLVSADGGAYLEPEDKDRLRLVRLSTLAEMDAHRVREAKVVDH